MNYFLSYLERAGFFSVAGSGFFLIVGYGSGFFGFGSGSTPPGSATGQSPRPVPPLNCRIVASFLYIIKLLETRQNFFQSNEFKKGIEAVILNALNTLYLPFIPVGHVVKLAFSPTICFLPHFLYDS